MSAGSQLSVGGVENALPLGGLTAALPSPQPQALLQPPPWPPPVHSRDILQRAHPLARPLLWLLSHFASSVRTEGKNVFSWALAASTGEASSLMEGEQSWENPAPQGSRNLGIQLQFPTHSHSLCDFRYATPSLWASVSQHAKPLLSLRCLLTLTILEFRTSDSGLERSSRTTGRVEALRMGKEISEGFLEAGMRTQTQTISLEHSSASPAYPGSSFG